MKLGFTTILLALIAISGTVQEASAQIPEGFEGWTGYLVDEKGDTLRFMFPVFLTTDGGWVSNRIGQLVHGSLTSKVGPYTYVQSTDTAMAEVNIYQKEVFGEHYIRWELHNWWGSGPSRIADTGWVHVAVGTIDEANQVRRIFKFVNAWRIAVAYHLFLETGEWEIGSSPDYGLVLVAKE